MALVPGIVLTHWHSLPTLFWVHHLKCETREVV